jgi:hypothetical protein
VGRFGGPRSARAGRRETDRVAALLDEIAAERARQIAGGRGRRDDDLCVLVNVMTVASTIAASITMPSSTFMRRERIPGQQTTSRGQLIVAAALLVAEIERLDRIRPAPE